MATHQIYQQQLTRFGPSSTLTLAPWNLISFYTQVIIASSSSPANTVSGQPGYYHHSGSTYPSSSHYAHSRQQHDSDPSWATTTNFSIWVNTDNHSTG
ncbi:unnamed protein product [Absidia cylindrospora]